MQETMDQQVARYIEGLRLDLKNELIIRPIYTISEPISLAYKVEMNHPSSKGQGSFRSSYSRPNANEKSKPGLSFHCAILLFVGHSQRIDSLQI